MALIPRILQVHRNPEGITLPVYRDYDLAGNLGAVKMAYMTTIEPGTRKGPILHRRRNSIVSILSGSIRLTYREPENELKSLLLSTDMHAVIDVPPNVAVEYDNSAGVVPAILFILADYAWKPEDDESMKYNSWDEAGIR